jgi:hypothetical protein
MSIADALAAAAAVTEAAAGDAEAVGLVPFASSATTPESPRDDDEDEDGDCSGEPVTSGYNLGRMERATPDADADEPVRPPLVGAARCDDEDEDDDGDEASALPPALDDFRSTGETHSSSSAAPARVGVRGVVLRFDGGFDEEEMDEPVPVPVAVPVAVP